MNPLKIQQYRKTTKGTKNIELQAYRMYNNKSCDASTIVASL